jgi:regulator of RNase E activity RraA
MNAQIRACFPEISPMVGFAATATFRSAGQPRRGDSYESISTQVKRFGELSTPPIVVFQDLDEPSHAATFGEVMCTTYQAFGAVGLITSGAGRDLEQVRALDFPVFTNGTICSHGYNHTPQIHIPVHVGGLTIYPNDLLHGDLNGITTIPIEIAAELADIGAEFVAAESLVLDYLRNRPPSLKQFQEVYSESKARIAKLRAEVSRVK